VANITLSEHRQVPDLIQASTRRAVEWFSCKPSASRAIRAWSIK
jgi:hypothetical protein